VETAPVPAERDLGRLLASIEPQLQAGVYAFCTLGTGEEMVGLDVVMLFRERGATTIVVPLADARAQGLAWEFSCQWITLGVHSDLGAVGLLAAITSSLAAAGISTNVVSAYHHDHLFVPAGRGDEAAAVLQELQRRHQAGQD
jgi:uncharacterized protein